MQLSQNTITPQQIPAAFRGYKTYPGHGTKNWGVRTRWASRSVLAILWLYEKLQEQTQHQLTLTLTYEPGYPALYCIY